VKKYKKSKFSPRLPTNNSIELIYSSVSIQASPQGVYESVFNFIRWLDYIEKNNRNREKVDEDESRTSLLSLVAFAIDLRTTMSLTFQQLINNIDERY